jgi:hypothetical protein
MINRTNSFIACGAFATGNIGCNEKGRVTRRSYGGYLVPGQGMRFANIINGLEFSGGTALSGTTKKARGDFWFIGVKIAGPESLSREESILDLRYAP